MEAAVLCETMGWTYSDYLDQPAHFVQTIISMLNERERARERQAKEIETKART